MNFARRSRFASLLVLAAIVIVGCDSGPSDDTQISDLTELELVDLCGNHRLVWEPSLMDFCEVDAVLGSEGDEASCVEMRDQCTATWPEGSGWLSDDCGSARAGFPETCRARVGIYRECMQYLTENLANHLRDDYACGRPLELMSEWPAACVLFNDSCPGYLEPKYGAFFSVELP